MRAVRPGPSPAVLWSAATAEASEVSRFSCMKCLGVSGVYDYAGLNRDSRLRLCPCCLPLDQQRRHPDLVFSKLDTQPTYSPVYASSYTSRCTTQNSGPSGSLLLPRKNFPFSASCRFIPAHWSPTLRTEQRRAKDGAPSIGWRFWIHASSRFRVPHPCVARVGDHNRWQRRLPAMIFGKQPSVFSRCHTFVISTGAQRSGEMTN